jgi:hypothetical protein
MLLWLTIYPILTFSGNLSEEHADQALPHPITISVKLGDLVLLKDLLPLHWDFGGPSLIWSFSQHPVLSSSMGSSSGGTSQGTVRKMKKGVGGVLESSRE